MGRKLRDGIIGAVSAIAVTVIGGVGVYYATKEPELSGKEFLVYDVRSSGDFAGEKERVAFSSVVVTNKGGRVATGVAVELSLKGSEIKDLGSDAALGNETLRRVTSENALLNYSRILPGESLTIDILLSAPAVPRVVVRSDESLAVLDTSAGPGTDHGKSFFNKSAQFLVPLGGIFGVLTGFVLFRLRGTAEQSSESRNNTGFLLLHNGLVKEADDVLTSAVKAGHYDAMVLSNLSVCKALLGEPLKAEALMSAANYEEVKGHVAAVVRFNEGLIELHAGNRPKAIHLFSVALAASPKDVRRYCLKSVHLVGERSEADFSALLSGARFEQ